MAKKPKIAILGAAEVRRQTFDGLPIVDAKADFTLLIHTRNVKAAKGRQKDVANCILAKACREQVGATIVAFMRRTAYLDLPDAKGNRRVVRYMLDHDAAAIVSAFDRGKSVKGEAMVTLRAPTPSQSLDEQRSSSRRNRERNRRAVLHGEIVGSTGNKATLFQKPRVSQIDVRNGTGLVHNVVKAAGK